VCPHERTLSSPLAMVLISNQLIGISYLPEPHNMTTISKQVQIP